MKKFLFVYASLLISLLFVSCEKGDVEENTRNESRTYSFVRNYVDSLDAVMTSDGYIALCGVTEMQVSDSVCLDKSRTIYITHIDTVNGSIDHNEDMVIFLDSLNFPTSITTSNCTYTVMNNNGESFDLMYVKGDDEPQFYSNVKLGETSMTRGVSLTRASGDLASSEPIPFTGLDDILSAIGKTENLYNIITATTNGEKVSAGLGALANLLGDAGWAEGSLFIGGAGDAMAGSLHSSYLGLASYMWTENQKFILKHLGPWRISIQSVEQKERGSLEIGYTVEGLNLPTEGLPKINLLCQNLKTRKYTTIPLGSTTNGVYTYKISNLEAGQYGVEMRLFDECHSATNISVMTYPQVKADVYDIGLNRVEVEDNPQYVNGTVNFDLDIFIDGSEDGLQGLSEFGYYIKFANSIEYHKVDHLSYIFTSTPVTCELPIEKEGFFKMDTNNFIAEATDYYAGVYVVNKKGDEILYFDEKRIEGLVYNKKPSLTFTKAWLGETDVMNDDDGSPSYCSTEIFATYYAEGTFWTTDCDLVVIEGSASDEVGYWDVLADGDNDFSAYYSYPYDSDNTSAFRFDMIMQDGKRISSANAIEVSGTPVINNIRLIDNTVSSAKRHRSNRNPNGCHSVFSRRSKGVKVAGR